MFSIIVENTYKVGEANIVAGPISNIEDFTGLLHDSDGVVYEAALPIGKMADSNKGFGIRIFGDVDVSNLKGETLTSSI